MISKMDPKMDVVIGSKTSTIYVSFLDIQEKNMYVYVSQLMSHILELQS